MVRVDVCTLKSFSRVLYERLAIYICYIKNLKIYIQYSQEVYAHYCIYYNIYVVINYVQIY